MVNLGLVLQSRSEFTVARVKRWKDEQIRHLTFIRQRCLLQFGVRVIEVHLTHVGTCARARPNGQVVLTPRGRMATRFLNFEGPPIVPVIGNGAEANHEVGHEFFGVAASLDGLFNNQHEVTPGPLGEASQLGDP
jgi:hypothetical protein